MADVKVSGLPNKSTPVAADYVVLNDSTGPTTKRGLLSALATFFFTQSNIPAGSGSPVTRFDEAFVDFVASGGVWTGDSVGVNRNASMTAAVVYINGRRISISAVVARTFTASKDTYIDVLDNGDGTGTLVYTEVTNGAASPALAANSIRLGYIITGATTIAATTSVIQYGIDSLGNFRRNTSPNATPITIYTNPATAAGTFYYRTIDGVKEIWGSMNNATGAVGGQANQITFPVGFFNVAPMLQATIGPNATSNSQWPNIGGSALTTVSCIINITGAATAAEFMQIYARGW